MESIPVAGQLVRDTFLASYSLRDLEVFAIPGGLMVVPRIVGLRPIYYAPFGVIGALLAVVILWQSPAAQRPSKWAFHRAYNRLRWGTYLKQPPASADRRGKHMDVILTDQADSDSAPSEGDE